MQFRKLANLLGDVSVGDLRGVYQLGRYLHEGKWDALPSRLTTGRV
jgi:hypothetical protein